MGPGERRLKRLIVTADDFGLSIPVNEAVAGAHRDGILTAASLMMGADATADAVDRARALPDLAVGLHLTVVDGRPLLPPGEIPDLVDATGHFSQRLVRAGFRYYFLPAVRRQLAQEIRAQFQAFRDTGLALDHVNAHHHMHLHPVVLDLIIRIGAGFGLKAVRLPAEALSTGSGLNVPRLLLGPWLAHMRRRLRRARLRFNEQIYGLRDSGRLDSGVLLRVLERLPDGAGELFLHPATGSWPGLAGAAAGYRHVDEYRALIDPAVAAAVRSAGIRLIAFRDLG